jgi:hypothetical protein
VYERPGSLPYGEGQVSDSGRGHHPDDVQLHRGPQRAEERRPAAEPPVPSACSGLGSGPVINPSAEAARALNTTLMRHRRGRWGDGSQYCSHPPRYEYVLTDKGLELCELLMVMVRWGDRWTAGEAGPPVLYRHHACGQIGHAELHCSHCGQPMHADDIDVLPGPGAALAES